MDTEVEVCSDGDAEGLTPASLVVEINAGEDPLVAAWIVLPYAEGIGGLALWAEDAGGELVRQLRATDSGIAFEGPLYRLGTALVAVDPRHDEPYRPGGNALADLLFVVDDSPGSGPLQAQLADQFSGLFSDLTDRGVDYHVGVTSTDLDARGDGSNGALARHGQARWVEPAHADPASLFRSMVDLGASGSNEPAGLGAVFKALETEADGTNTGFLRDAAWLTVVVVSDEADHTSLAVITVAELVDWFRGLKPDPSATSFNDIVDPVQGADYVETTSHVGGSVLDVASDDWTPFLLDLIEPFGLASRLEQNARDGTVEVWVIPADGAEPYPLGPDEFVFDDDRNTVRVLLGARMADGDELVILYDPA